MASSKNSTSVRIKSSIPRVAILVDTSTTWGRRVIKGVSDYIRDYGQWQLFLEARGIEERLHVPPGWQGDGVIARISSLSMSKELEALKLPVVNVSAIHLSRTSFPRVTTNQEEVARMAYSYFADRGFKNFAYFSILGVSYVASQRDAFLRVVREHGNDCSVYSVKPQAGAEPDWNLDLARLGQWLKGLPKPLGILAWNASGGREILHACRLVGLLVPEEVSVLCGSDDDVLCEHLYPPLSGVLVDAERNGYSAAALLDQLMRGKPAPPKPTLIPPLTVVTRQSTDTLAMGDPKLSKAIAFIRENASKPIQVSDVTKNSGLSRRVLERRFLQVLDRTPASEIRRVHLERARELLIETKLPIPDIAEATGFGSPEYFASAFKSQTGMTPLQYRKTMRS
jgi:LacI family transcriptional regulator